MKINRRHLLLTAVLLSSAGLSLCLFIFAKQALHEHIDGFGKDLHQWKPYGGSWELNKGIIRNNSDERGAKLITGSSFAGDYKVEADVAVLGNYGDAGLIVRARDVGRGVDSYRGFFAGVQTLDNALLFGRSDYGWEGYKNNTIPGGIAVGQFYHLQLVAVGCAIAARVDLPNGQSVREGVELATCVRTGQVGLKSYQNPGMWKNFRVSPATKKDLLDLMGGVPLGSRRNGQLHTMGPNLDEEGQLRKEALSRKLDRPTTMISAIPLLSPLQTTEVSIHGVVTLISPETYVEDQTGGIAVLSHDASALAIGDEVEVTGAALQSSGKFVLRNAHVKTLWSNTVSFPPMITADEAATGARDGRLVALDGQLIRKSNTGGGRMILELESSDELFQAIAEASHYKSSLQDVRLGSELQIVGVISSDQRFAGDSAFGVLVSPNEDAIQVVRAASWWTPTKVVIGSITAVLILFIVIILIHRNKENYLRQVSNDRELLANDLHDTVSQSLAGIGFQLTSAATNISKSDIALQQLTRAREMVKESHEELRRSITTLRLEIAAIDDLVDALRALAVRLVGDGPMRITCSSEGKTMRLPLAVADCFFRVGQEAISNAVLHSGGSLLKIDLLQQDGRVTLRVIDNGLGLCQIRRDSGFGIYGMAKRAEMIGAHFEVTTDSEGTTVLLQSDAQSRRGLKNSTALFPLLGRRGNAWLRRVL